MLRFVYKTIFHCAVHYNNTHCFSCRRFKKKAVWFLCDFLTNNFNKFTQANKQLLDEVFVICRIINVEVRVISRAEGEADNYFRDIDNFAYHKNRVQ